MSSTSKYDVHFTDLQKRMTYSKLKWRLLDSKTILKHYSIPFKQPAVTQNNYASHQSLKKSIFSNPSHSIEFGNFFKIANFTAISLYLSLQYHHSNINVILRSTSENFSPEIGDRCKRRHWPKMKVWPRKEVKLRPMWAISKILLLTQYWRIFTFFWCLCLYAVDLLPIFLYYSPQWISAKISKFDSNSKTNEALKRLPSTSEVFLYQSEQPKSFLSTFKAYLPDLNHPQRLKEWRESI